MSIVEFGPRLKSLPEFLFPHLNASHYYAVACCQVAVENVPMVVF
jgi:hypothetical protein